MDPDLWGHLRFGLDALRSRHLPAVDPYSFMHESAWINHEWLSEVVQAIAFRAAGVPGLLLLKTALVASAAALVWRAAASVPGSYRWWMLASAFLAMAPAAYTMRPQLWTLVAVPLLWRVLDDRRWLAALPLLFAIWANLHGGWIVGAGVAALWTIGRAIDGRSVRGVLPHAGAVAAAMAATLVNPYGWRLWLFLLATVRLSRNVSEWEPLWRQEDPTSAILWAAVTAVIVVPTVLRRTRRLTWAAALPVAFLGVTSVLVARLVPLFGEVAALAAFAAVRRSGGFAVVRGSSFGARRVIDALAVAAIAAINLIPQSRCLAVEGPWIPDLSVARAFDAPTVQGRLVVPFNWGEYAIWHWGPRLRVSIDGRRETVYSEHAIAMAAAVARGLPDGLEYLRQARPEYVWLSRPNGAPAADWLRSNGYRLDADTPRSFIATRADLPPLTIGAPIAACFP